MFNNSNIVIGQVSVLENSKLAFIYCTCQCQIWIDRDEDQWEKGITCVAFTQSVAYVPCSNVWQLRSRDVYSQKYLFDLMIQSSNETRSITYIIWRLLRCFFTDPKSLCIADCSSFKFLIALSFLNFLYSSSVFLINFPSNEFVSITQSS